jgi:hypothetical protein
VAYLFASAVRDAFGKEFDTSPAAAGFEGYDGGPLFAYGWSVEGSWMDGLRWEESWFPDAVLEEARWGWGVGFELMRPDLVTTYATARVSTTTSVPTPALLPGLMGMGIAAYRKHKQFSSITAPSTSA